MLSPLKELLENYQLILASTSSQRKAIWKQIGLKFISTPSSFDEEKVNPNHFSTPSDFVKHLARGKALAVVQELSGAEKNSVVVGADTVIVDGNTIIGKPHTESKAIETLQSLSGRRHKVCTGVAIMLTTGAKNRSGVKKEDLFVSSTEVEFAPLSSEVIKSYVGTGEPLNKAGAYGIQGIGALLVKSIHGDYYNVVGFPIQEFCERLESFLRDADTK